MQSVKEFFLEQAKYFEKMQKINHDENVKTLAYEAIRHFCKDLCDRLRERVSELDADEVFFTVFEWFANISAAVPAEDEDTGSEAPDFDCCTIDENGDLVCGAAEAELDIKIGPFEWHGRPPKPMPPRPYPPHDHRRQGPPPPPPVDPHRNRR